MTSAAKGKRTLELARDTEVTSDAGRASADAPSLTPQFLRDREKEEPLGRWMNRCTYIHNVATGWQYVVCDRKTSHKGLHQGRLYDFNGGRLLGWAVVR